MKNPIKTKLNQAFSLVELLVVIAVIAVIAAIAIPNIANITNTADTSKNLRNAQFLVQTYNGYVDFVEGSGDTNAVAGLVAAPTVSDALTVLTANDGVGTAVTNVRLNESMTFGIGQLQSQDIAADRIGNAGNKLILTNAAP